MTANKKIIIVSVLVLSAWAGLYYAAQNKEKKELNPIVEKQEEKRLPSVSADQNEVSVKFGQEILVNDYYISQTFNNCAPAALSMALSYYGIRASQEVLAASLRPNNNRTGTNDDKSTPPEELAAKAREYGLSAYFRPNGDIDTIKALIDSGVPVVIRTLLNTSEDFAHYRVIKGYDDKSGEIIQDDSYQGKNLRYSYDDFLEIWKPFNYGFLVLAKPSQKESVESALGENLDEDNAWQSAVERAEDELANNRNDVAARLNLSVALYYTGDYKRSASEFEKAENILPRRALWYQIEPIKSYFELGNYERVLSLSDEILNDNNKGYAELYLLKGKVYLAEGDKVKAREEFEKAFLYNKNSQAILDALNSLD